MRPNHATNGAQADGVCSRQFAGGNGAALRGHNLEEQASDAKPKRERIEAAILRAADVYYAREEFATACDFLELLDACSAHTPETLQTLGNLRFLLGQFDAAAAAYQRACSLTPNKAGLWLALALTSRQRNDGLALRTSLDRALELDPQNSDSLKLLADCLRDQGEYPDAARIYGELIHRDTRNLDVCLSLAHCFIKTGDLEGGISVLQHILTLDPSQDLVRKKLSELQSLLSAKTTQGATVS